MQFHVYILRLSDGRYYVGHTDDLATRIAQHRSGAVPGYTRDKLPLESLWSEQFPEREQAFTAERQLKGWSRAKKEALMRGDFGALKDLARRRTVLREAVSSSSTAPQDERINSSAHPEEGLSEGEGPSRRTTVGPATPPPPAVVLVRPQLGENIGKAARAMLNFGLTDLRLVSPRDGWPNPAAGPAASGADVVLEKAGLFDSVAEAVADCGHVYATTVRKRGLVVPVVTPEQAAREIRTQAERSAILFGAERSGLETDEVAIAGKILTVPINPEFRSLNLAQAVIIVAYEWSKHEALAVPTQSEDSEPLATQDQVEGLIRQLEASLEQAGYYHPPDRTPATKNTIRTILTKAGWSNREVQAMRGVIRALAEPRPDRQARSASKRSSS